MKFRSDSFRVLSGRGEFVGFICALCLILLFLIFPGTALASNVGYLDPSFGTGGIVKTTFSSPDNAFAMDVAVQTDGKILVAGYANGSKGVGRFLSDGSLDTGFGVGGWASTGWIDGATFAPLAIQPDGRIVVADVAYSGSGNVGLARFDSDGTLDTAFGTGGVTETYIGPDLYPSYNSMVLQPDGKILVGCLAGDPTQLLLIRYLPDGSPDNTFGTGGIVMEAGYGPYDMAIQPDGRILVVGSDAVKRYNQDGSLDTSFGTAGVTTITVPGKFAGVCSVSLLSDGHILVSGFLAGFFPLLGIEDNPVFLARLNSDGTFDTGFGTDGITTAYVPGDLWMTRAWHMVHDMLVQPDGRIVLVGWSDTSENYGGGAREIMVARFLADGSPDLGFHRTGWVIQDIENNWQGQGWGVALQSDGRIVAAGDSYNSADTPPGSIVVLRYLAEDATVPVTAVSMGPDISNTSLVKVLDSAFSETGSFTAFDAASVRYGARVALGDIDGDGADELIAAKGEGGANNSEVKAYEIDGTPVSGANFVAFSSTYRGGANVAAGDLDGDGNEEIIVGSSERRPLVRILSYDPWGQVMVNRVSTFNPYPGTIEGVSIAAADLDGDGVDELITAPAAKSAAPSVAVWSMNYDLFSHEWLVNPYSGSFSVPLAADLLMSATGGGASLAATGGLFAAGTGAGGGEAELYKGASVYDCRIPLGDTATRQRTGIELAAGDADGDGLDEILLALGRNPGSSTVFSVYDSLCGWETDIGPVFPGAAYGARLAVGSTF